MTRPASRSRLRCFRGAKRPHPAGPNRCKPPVGVGGGHRPAPPPEALGQRCQPSGRALRPPQLREAAMAEPTAARGVAPSDLGSYQHAVRLVLTNDLITASRPRAGVLAAVLRWADLMSRDFAE